MVDSKIIVAIDLGSSRIRGIMGRQESNGQLTVLATEEYPSDKNTRSGVVYIRRGIVYNSTKTQAKVNELIESLERKSGKQVDKVYIPVAGQSLYAMPYSVSEEFASSTVIDENRLAHLRQKALNHKVEKDDKYADKINYGVLDVEYLIDERPDMEPIGVSCMGIEAQYQLLVGRPDILTKYKGLFQDNQRVKLANEILYGSVCATHAVLKQDDKDLGCVLLDFGAGTTSISIYHQGVLRAFVTLPLGGNVLTSDIASELNKTEADAEAAKIKDGKASVKSKSSSSFLTPFSSAKNEDNIQMNTVIIERLDEFVANIKAIIERNGLNNKLVAGAIIMGGGSNLSNLADYLTDKLDMKVRHATLEGVSVKDGANVTDNIQEWAKLIGALALANESCEFIPPVEPKPIITEPEPELPEEPELEEEKKDVHKPEKEDKTKTNKPKKKSITDSVINFFGGLFDDEDDSESNN